MNSANSSILRVIFHSNSGRQNNKNRQLTAYKGAMKFLSDGLRVQLITRTSIEPLVKNKKALGDRLFFFINVNIYLSIDKVVGTSTFFYNCSD